METGVLCASRFFCPHYRLEVQPDANKLDCDLDPFSFAGRETKKCMLLGKPFNNRDYMVQKKADLKRTPIRKEGCHKVKYSSRGKLTAELCKQVKYEDRMRVTVTKLIISTFDPKSAEWSVMELPAEVDNYPSIISRSPVRRSSNSFSPVHCSTVFRTRSNAGSSPVQLFF
ncbi:hypothetical protein C5167_033237 [Papaver somniferum]|uniref:Uncharacterized protein n=1 Tax=Papaver somniferum TaxID=3469 RepID=A0A4Y7KAW4_PAPSO|nr:hypothetical protein C5167_033237 [Papaver somniferum]